MRIALIGHTGFVGSNLLRQTRFDATYNSSNIETIAGEEFDLLVCAGVRAEKWIANANPDADLAAIDRLIQALDGAIAKRAILISSVDVFIAPIEVDETTPVVTTGLHPYGVNRYDLEQRFADRFDAVVARLPGLYGPGIKKNVVHDFLYEHEVEKVDSRAIFQFYGLHRLWDDLQVAMTNHLPLVHFPTEPVSVAEVARAAFDREFTNQVVASPARYDVRTRHAALFGGDGVYLENKTAELEGIRRFIDKERATDAASRDLKP
jgi:nucleoside-diphosphate-sugar epimerase